MPKPPFAAGCTRAVLAAALLATLSACGDPPGTSSVRGTEAPAPSAPAYAPSEFLSARDVFTTATEPEAVPAAAASWVEDEHEVYGVLVNGHARAYPIVFLAYHHAVNDVLDGTPILVTYCIVCSSGMAFDPVVKGERLLFGLEGSWRGTATLYDRATKSIWLQLTGECVEGAYEGTTLGWLGTGRHTTWRDWRRAHPDTDVMAPATGQLAPGHRYYAPKQTRSGSPFVPPEMRPILPKPDPRLRENELLYGLVVDGRARAYPLARLRDTPVVGDRLGDTAVSVWFDAPSRSFAAFRPRAQDPLSSQSGSAVALRFRRVGDGRFEDLETGSTWNMEGVCVAGRLSGARLEPVRGLLTEWYGWHVRYPDTEIWGAP